MASVVFYDGVCGLCSRLVRFLLRRDRDGRLLFAPLQGGLARAVLGRHGYDPSDLDTVYVMRTGGARPSRRRTLRAGVEASVCFPSRARSFTRLACSVAWRVWAGWVVVHVALADARHGVAKRAIGPSGS